MGTLPAPFQVWRCRVVWDSLRVIIIPCFLWLATFREYHSLLVTIVPTLFQISFWDPGRRHPEDRCLHRDFC